MRVKKIVRKALLLSLLGSVSVGCVDKNTIKEKASFIGDSTPENKVIAELPEPTSIRTYEDLTEEEKLIFQEEYKYTEAQYVLPDSDVTEYVSNVASKLISTLPADKQPDVEIQVTTDQTIQAHSAFDRTIHVSLGTLLNLKSEDELAFLLGHEIAHLSLHHNDETYQRESRSRKVSALADDAIMYGKQLYDVKTHLEGNNQLDNKDAQILDESVTKISYLQKHVSHLQNGLMNPLMTRDEEQDADYLAIDMMVEAGYNRNASADFLKTLKSYRSNTADQMKRQQEALKQAKTDLESNLTKMVQSGDIKTNEAEALVKGSAENLIVSSAEDILDKVFTKDHFDPEKRLDNTNQYIAKHYARERKPVLQTQGYADFSKKVQLESLVADMVLINTIDEKLTYTQLQSDELLKLEESLIAIVRRNRENSYAWTTFAKLRDQQGRESDYVENLSIASQKTNANYQTINLLMQYYTKASNPEKIEETYNLANQLFDYEDILFQ